MNRDLDHNLAASQGGAGAEEADVSALVSDLTWLSYFFLQGYLVRMGFPSDQRT